MKRNKIIIILLVTLSFVIRVELLNSKDNMVYSANQVKCRFGNSHFFNVFNNRISGQGVIVKTIIKKGLIQAVIKASNCNISKSNILRNDNINTGISIFPNPSTDNINIGNIPIEQLPLRLLVTDIEGRVLDTISAGNTDIQLDVSLYPSGNYFIILENGNFMKSYKFQKL